MRTCAQNYAPYATRARHADSSIPLLRPFVEHSLSWMPSRRADGVFTDKENVRRRTLWDRVRLAQTPHGGLIAPLSAIFRRVWTENEGVPTMPRHGEVVLSEKGRSWRVSETPHEEPQDYLNLVIATLDYESRGALAGTRKSLSAHDPSCFASPERYLGPRRARKRWRPVSRLSERRRHHPVPRRAHRRGRGEARERRALCCCCVPISIGRIRLGSALDRL